jgi:regulatory protein YycH of two-component signal transduction system YycFG
MEGFDEAVKWLREGLEEGNMEMVLVTHNKDTGTVKILGVKMQEEEVPMLLISAANHIAGHVVDTYENRTLN